MTFTRIKPYGPDSYTYWISGIYKIVSYRSRSFHAYFIQDYQKTWGDHVETPPNRCPLTNNEHWSTLKSAKEACGRHAERHDPKQSTVKNAAERLEEIKALASEHSVAA